MQLPQAEHQCTRGRLAVRRKRVRYHAWHHGMPRSTCSSAASPTRIPRASADELGAFEALLDVPDPDILAGSTGEPPIGPARRALRRLYALPPWRHVMAAGPLLSKPLERAFAGPAPVTLASVPDALVGKVLADLASTKARVAFVARDGQRLARDRAPLAFFAPGVESSAFPAWDCLPYDRVSPHPAVVPGAWRRSRGSFSRPTGRRWC